MSELLASLFGDEVPPTKEEIIVQYAHRLIVQPPVRSVDVVHVGQEKARRMAKELARKDVERFFNAVADIQEARRSNG